MSNENTAYINDLAPIAKRMADRQEEIDSAQRKTMDAASNVGALIAEQGRDIQVAKTKLAGKPVSWKEWLANCVPNMHAKAAARYERVVKESISDPRQYMLAILPPRERQHREADVEAPAAWEKAWAYAARIQRIARDNPLTAWQESQLLALRKALEPVAKALWPERWA